MRSLGATLRPRNAGGDHNGTPLRQERTGAGVRGGAPVRPLLRQRRDTPGVRNGAQPPVASGPKGHEPAHAVLRVTSRGYQAVNALTAGDREELILCGVTPGVTLVLA